jgi:hypothetical protein
MPTEILLVSLCFSSQINVFCSSQCLPNLVSDEMRSIIGLSDDEHRNLKVPRLCLFVPGWLRSVPVPAASCGTASLTSCYLIPAENSEICNLWYWSLSLVRLPPRAVLNLPMKYWLHCKLFSGHWEFTDRNLPLFRYRVYLTTLYQLQGLGTGEWYINVKVQNIWYFRV